MQRCDGEMCWLSGSSRGRGGDAGVTVTPREVCAVRVLCGKVGRRDGVLEREASVQQRKALPVPVLSQS